MTSTSQQKSILITGCSTGIGLSAALELNKRNYQVFAGVRQQQDCKKLQELGLKPVILDLDDSNSINTAVDSVLQQTDGKLYALFNNAAYGQPGAVEDLRRDVLRKQFETNFFGTIELTNRIVPVMREQGEGRIIVNSSVLGIIALPMRGAYNASKFALEGMFDTLRLELRSSNIHVSLIEPGPILSAFRANAMRAFQDNIDIDNSYHQASYHRTLSRLNKVGATVPFTLGPEAVTKRVIHALESKRPKIRYPVTFPTYLFGFLRRILPARMLDKMLMRTEKVGNQ